jgi:hypothetical protein
LEVHRVSPFRKFRLRSMPKGCLAVPARTAAVASSGAGQSATGSTIQTAGCVGSAALRPEVAAPVTSAGCLIKLLKRPYDTQLGGPKSMSQKRKVRIGRLTTVGDVAAELGRLVSTGATRGCSGYRCQPARDNPGGHAAMPRSLRARAPDCGDGSHSRACHYRFGRAL